MCDGAIAQWLKQLEAGQLCPQQLQRRGKGGLFCSSAKATAEFSPPLTLLSAPCSWQRQNPQPKGEGRAAGCKPSLFPPQILTPSSRQSSASAPAPPWAGGLLSTHRGVGRSSAGWRFPGAWPWLPGADSLPRVALPNTRDPEGYLSGKLTKRGWWEHLLPTLAKHKCN